MFEREYDYGAHEAYLGGIHIGKCITNSDPLALERVRVRILGVHDMTVEDEENSIWAVHIAPSKSNSGEVPDPDDWVYCVFLDKNDPMSCAWIGWVRVGS